MYLQGQTEMHKFNLALTSLPPLDKFGFLGGKKHLTFFVLSSMGTASSTSFGKV